MGGKIVSWTTSRLRLVGTAQHDRDIFNDLPKRIERLGEFFKLSDGTLQEGLMNARQVMSQPGTHRVNDALLSVRESAVFKRHKEYGNNVAAFINRLAGRPMPAPRIVNNLKSNTTRTTRTDRASPSIVRLANQQHGDILCIPVVQEDVVMTIKRTRISSGDVLIGSFEYLCELVANPDRFRERTFIADGDTVIHDGEECAPSFTLNGKLVIGAVPIKAAPKPLYRKLTGVMP